MLRRHISASSDIYTYTGKTISPNALMCRIAPIGDVRRPLVCYHEPTCRHVTDEMTSQRFSRTVPIASSVVITRLRRHPIVDHNFIWNLKSCCSSWHQPRSLVTFSEYPVVSFPQIQDPIVDSPNNVTTFRCQLVWTECSVCGIRMTRLENVLKFSYKIRT